MKGSEIVMDVTEFSISDIEIDNELSLNEHVDLTDPIYESKSTLISDNVDYILDDDWARSSFAVGNDKFKSNYVKGLRSWSQANIKYTDTSFGGNKAINPRPQGCQFADIRPNLSKRNTNPVTPVSDGNHGMGRYYSESLDDNAHRIYMQMGIAQHTSLIRFLSLAVDPNTSSVVRLAKGKSAFYKIGAGIGTIVAVVRFPVMATLVLLGRELFGDMIAPANSKYYTMKPTMHQYWASVQTLMNSFNVSSGVVPTTFDREKSGLKVNSAAMEEYAKLMPEVFSANGHVDIFSLANRIGRMERKNLITRYRKIIKSGEKIEYEKYISDTLKEVHLNGIDEPSSFIEMIEGAVSRGEYKLTESSNKDAGVDQSTISSIPDSFLERIVGTAEEGLSAVGELIGASFKYSSEAIESFTNNFEANVSDGGEYAVFNVDYPGQHSTSFSTTTRASALKSALNSVSSNSRSVFFSSGGGNIGDGVFFDTIESGIGAVKDTVEGALTGVTFGLSNVLGALLGESYIDAPDEWEDSTVALPSIQYKISLISPYADPISRMKHIYMPLSMLLAAALPISVGKESYSSPYLVSLFDRGHQNIKLGIIESLNLSVGVSNLGFSSTGAPLAIDVTFNVKDLSSLMHMPISDNGLFGTNTTIDEDHLMFNFINTLTARSHETEAYVLSKFNFKKTVSFQNKQTAFGSAFWASYMSNGTIGDMHTMFAPPTDIVIDDL